MIVYDIYSPFHNPAPIIISTVFHFRFIAKYYGRYYTFNGKILSRKKSAPEDGCGFFGFLSGIGAVSYFSLR